MNREHQRALACADQFTREGGARTLSQARNVLGALADAETYILYPAFSRVSMRFETQRLLEDSRESRARQLDVLDVLAHRRASRLRKLALAELRDRIEHHGTQHGSLLIPVVASQLPRPLYRWLATAFTARYDGALAHAGARRSAGKK